MHSTASKIEELRRNKLTHSWISDPNKSIGEQKQNAGSNHAHLIGLSVLAMAL